MEVDEDVLAYNAASRAWDGRDQPLLLRIEAVAIWGACHDVEASNHDVVGFFLEQETDFVAVRGSHLLDVSVTELYVEWVSEQICIDGFFECLELIENIYILPL